MAGVFICIVALFYKIVISDNTIGPGPTRFFGGIAFCVGLILVLIAGAELFTANALVVIPWLEGQVSSLLLLCNRGLVNLGNLTGAIAVAVSLFWGCAWQYLRRRGSCCGEFLGNLHMGRHSTRRQSRAGLTRSVSDLS